MIQHSYHLIVCLLITLLPAPAFAQPTILFKEGFDTQPAGAILPPGWEGFGSGWTVNGTGGATGSLPNSLMHMGKDPGWVDSPEIDLRGVQSATLSYQVRRTSTFPVSALRVVLTIDGGATYDQIVADYGDAVAAREAEFVLVEFPLPKSAMGRIVRVRFETTGGTHSLAKLNLDDITVTVPALGADPTSLSFQGEPGSSVTKTFTLFAVGRSATVTPILKSGSAFSLSPSEPTVISGGASKVYSVTFTPQGPGNVVDTLRLTSMAGDTVSIPLQGSTPRAGRFGFDSESSQALEGSTGVEITLGASYDRSPGIQGFQFTVSWDSDLISGLEVLPGAVVSDASRWQLIIEPGARSARVLLLGSGTTSLPSGDYPGLVRLRFGVGEIPADQPPTRFTLSNVITSLAVPTGDDALLSAKPDIHTLTLQEAYSGFIPEMKGMKLNPVRAESRRDSVLTVTNPGTVPLAIDSVISTNPLYRVSPTHATIGAGKSQSFKVSFLPTFTAFGYQQGNLVFQHASSDTIQVQALGTGGRGDPGNDGIVDVLDLVQVIDFVLARRSASSVERVSADLYPFATGDAALDVRDLTVLVQAIARAKWPDEIRLPEEMSTPPGASKYLATASLDGVVGRDTLFFSAQTDAEFRALQLVLKPDRMPGNIVNQLVGQGLTFISGYDPIKGTVRLVYYRSDGGSFTAGRRALARIACAGCTAVSLSYGVAVGTDGSRIAVRMEPVVGTPVDPEPVLPEQFGAGPVYPSPLGPGQVLRIPVTMPLESQVRLEVYDVLGRRVYQSEETLPAGKNTMEWAGDDSAGRPVAAGLYLLRLRTSGEVANLRVVVVR